MDPPDANDNDTMIEEEELGMSLLQQFSSVVSSSNESEEDATIIRETINHNDNIMNSIYGQWAKTTTSSSSSSLPLSSSSAASSSAPNNNSTNSSSGRGSSGNNNVVISPPHRPPRPPSRQRMDPPAILAKARSAISTTAREVAKKTATAGTASSSNAVNSSRSRSSRPRSDSSQQRHNQRAVVVVHPLSSSSPETHLQLYKQRQRFILCTLFIVSIVTLLFWGMIASRAESALMGSPTSTSFSNHSSFTNYSATSSSSSITTSSSASSSSSSSSSTSSHQYIGFHDPSYENIYGANHYYKPPGVGYMVRPRGGLHPIYMYDSESDADDNNSTTYYDDDYESSPYADLRLQMTDEKRALEQTEWKSKLQEIRDRYGYWDFKDEYNNDDGSGNHRPVVDWSTIGKTKKDDYNPLLGEIDKVDFPKGSWQTDDEYITKFITEGRLLIERVRSAIYEEYGWRDEKEEVDEAGGIQLVDDGNQATITLGGENILVWIYQSSFRALAKKLLNAMITNDHFFVTLGGHSAAAGHGNNFRQSYMLEFQHVMEPVFDRLGMVLVSANLAQGGMGTLQSALAGGSIYGDADFILWDSSMTEKDSRAQDTFMRQALLAGQRVPILLDMGGGKGTLDNLHHEVGAHVGGVTNVALLPKFKHTTIDFDEKKYNAACWIDRVDVHPDGQNPSYGGQASWHPGNWIHQSSARKIILLFLHALDEAFTVWEEAASKDGNPLDGKYWHLHTEEEAIRDALRLANATATECGNLFEFLPKVCTIPMRGATEWSPRNDPDHTSIRSLVKSSPIGYVPGLIDVQELVYRGRDPVFPSQRVPKGEVDVAAIARSLPPRDSSARRSLSSLARRRHHRHRRIETTSNILPGDGWSVHGHPGGYCDGTSNAECNRGSSFNCLMSGHNDARGVMKGDGLSGWLVLQLKDVTEGIFMARMEDWHNYNSNLRTEGWVEVNNGRVDERRRLKAPPPPHPPEFRFEVAVNGVIVSSWNSTEYKEQCRALSYNNGICLLWHDEERALRKEKEDVEIAMRLGGDGGRNAMMAISHIYYA